MRRISINLTVAALLTAALGAAADAAAATVISPKANPYYKYSGSRGTKGFGKVKPRLISYGGDPTSYVACIRWHRWGGDVARGTGVAWYVGPHEIVPQGHFAQATVVASRLGRWHGRRAYTKLRWTFPRQGRIRRTCSSAL